LESFSVENYRSITQARQITLADSTVLLGPNNEGKSNILRALNAAMLALTRSSRRAGYVNAGGRYQSRSRGDASRHYNWQKDFPISLAKSKNAGQTRVTLEFSLNNEEVEDFKREIKSNLNGTLPVCVNFGKESVEIKIVKQGRGSASLNGKSERIAKFLAERIQFQYIPAVRTAHEATRIVEEIIASELAEIEFQPAYQAALEAIKSLQKPVLDEFSKKTTETLKSFLPGMRSVKFSISDERRYTALRHAIDIEVDDGAVTSLEAKGDGVQSLVALGLRRHLLEESRERRTYIFAVEEPEAHLHPNAIHELREVLKDLSQVDQLIITTHSGLLANRSPVSSNIIVNRSKAFSAKNLSDIRTALGIRSNDNLLNAELVLLVEGDDDKLALRAVLGQRSPNLGRVDKRLQP
jgi:predicted ATP-dependent endonuclease of OLD family